MGKYSASPLDARPFKRFPSSPSYMCHRTAAASSKSHLPVISGPVIFCDCISERWNGFCVDPATELSTAIPPVYKWMPGPLPALLRSKWSASTAEGMSESISCIPVKCNASNDWSDKARGQNSGSGYAHSALAGLPVAGVRQPGSPPRRPSAKRSATVGPRFVFLVAVPCRERN